MHVNFCSPEPLLRQLRTYTNIPLQSAKNKAGIGFRTLKDAKELRKAGIDNLGPGPVVYPVTSKDVAARQRINTQAVLAFNMKVSRFF